MMSEYDHQLYTFVLTIKAWKQGIHLDENGDTYIKVLLDVQWSFYDGVISSQQAAPFEIGDALWKGY